MSTNSSTTGTQLAAEAEAAEWFVQMREPSVSAESRTAFGEWLRASPLHVGAYLEMARLWTDAAHIGRQLAVGLEAQLQSNVIPLRDASSEGEDEHACPGTPGHSRDRVETGSRGASSKSPLYALAASVLAACGVWWHLDRVPTYATGVGEQRVITLEDGSIVRLNSRSKLEVRLSPRHRQLDLVAGQALFEVAQDADRPFTVRSGGLDIRALGTQFDVNRKRSGTVVTVVEGRVKVGAMLLSADEQVKVSRNGAMKRADKPDTAAAIGWLRQELKFDDQPLVDVLDEFNRYSRVPIVLTDPSLAGLRINAVFHATSPESLLRFVARFDDVRIERSEREIRISRRR